MKRVISILLTIAMLLSLLPAVVANAQTKGSGTYQVRLTDMETMPENMADAASAWQGDLASFSPAAGKGYNGSDALAYTITSRTGSWGGENCFVYTGNFGGTTDWSQADMLWFWIDTSEYTDMMLQLMLSTQDFTCIVKPGSPVYLWQGGEPYAINGVDRWDGQSNFTLPKAYVGFVGIPFSSVKPASDAGTDTIDYTNMKAFGLYISGAENASVYVDEAWLTDANSTPDVEMTGHAKYAVQMTDMETLPEDVWTVSASWQGDLLNFEAASGKGFEDSTAFSYCNTSRDGSWGGDICFLSTKNMGATTNWSEAQMFWFWIDSSEYDAAPNMQIYVSGNGYNGMVKKGATIYYWDGTTMTPAAMGDRWDGMGYITLPTDYKGFIGVPFFGVKPLPDANRADMDYSDIQAIGVYLNSTENKPAYIDEIWITDLESKPGDVIAQPYAVCIENMNELPETLDASHVNSWCPADMTAAPAADKGVNGSGALAYSITNINAWGPNLFIYMNGFGMPTDWTKADIFWFWIDLSAYTTQQQLELRLGKADTSDLSMKIGAPYYLWDGESEELTTGTTVDNWNGERGRLTMPLGYKGFVGMPLDSMLDGLTKGNVTFFAVQTMGTENGTAYLDEFWLTDADSRPSVQSDPGPEPEPYAEKLTDAEALDVTKISAWSGNAVTTLATDKGFNGSGALAYTQTAYDWGSNAILSVKELGLKSDWTKADMLWFWVDASEFNDARNLDFRIADGNANEMKTMIIGKTYYTWDGANAKVAHTSISNWNGECALIPLDANYVGWIGVPFDCFDIPVYDNITYVYFHYENENSVGIPMYLDEFWITDKKSKPAINVVYEPQIPQWIPEGASFVWDMQALPADLGEAGWTQDVYGDGYGVSGGYIDFLCADGKSYDGSKALQWSYNGPYDDKYWGHQVTINMNNDTTMKTDWSGQEVIWFWIDATEFQADLFTMLYLNDTLPNGDAKYYKCGADGVVNTCYTQKDVNGDAYWLDGRINIGGFKGWIGIPFASFPDEITWNNVTKLRLYTEMNSATALSCYLDNFIISSDFEPVDKCVWDMESLTADFDKSSITTNWGATPLGKFVDVVYGENKGFNNSKAIGYAYLDNEMGNGDHTLGESNYSINYVLIDQISKLGMDTNLSGGELLWFWVDASEFTSQLNFEIHLNEKTAAIGETVYTWSGEGDVSTNGVTLDAWDHVTSRLPLPAGYKGFVGVSIANCDTDLSNISSIQLYMEPWNDKGSMPHTIWLDEFWVTPKGETPDVTICSHSNTVEIPAVAATCTEPGATAGLKCSDCGAILTAPTSINALGHDMITDAAVAATCTETGLTEGSHCSRCDYKVEQETVDALGHDMVTDAAVAATCTETGLTEGSHCSRCDYKVAQEIIDALGHDMITDAAVAATCTETGLTEGSHCSRCDYKVEQETVDALGHDMITDAAVTATCTEAGLTEGSHCSRCDYKVAQQTVNALGHDLITDAAVAATCTESGLTEGSHCSRCDYKVAQQKVEALGHDWDEGVVTTEPTTSSEGVKTFSCSRCDATKTETIEKLTVCDGGENCPGHAFTDMPVPGNWAHPGLDLMLELGLLKGESETTLAPDATMTREMLITVLWRYDGSEEGFTTSFTDVKNEWSVKAIAWAEAKEIVFGVGDGKFNPGEKLTREQMAVILYRYAAYKNIDTEEKADLGTFPDAADVSNFAKDAFGWAVKQGLINGSKEGGRTYLLPKAGASRAQVATVLMRYIQNIMRAK